MTFLVDTNVIAELRKGSRANANVRAWFEQLDADAIALSALTVGEIRRGIENLRRRDQVTARTLERWLHRLVADYRERIVPINEAIAEQWGRLNAPDPIPVVDGLLAATALVHGFTLATRNVRDIARTGVRFVNPFDAS